MIVTKEPSWEEIIAPQVAKVAEEARIREEAEKARLAAVEAARIAEENRVAAEAAARVKVVQAAPVQPRAQVYSGDPVAIGRSMNANRFGDQHWNALYQLWMHESGWNPNARNPSSGACGIPQALPCSKIRDMSISGQVSWGLSYIAERYGNPSNAWAHFQRNNWY